MSASTRYLHSAIAESMQAIESENLYNTLITLLLLWKYNSCVNKPLLARISKLQRESDNYNCTTIPRCVTENEYQSSFVYCFEAFWEALYTY